MKHEELYNSYISFALEGSMVIVRTADDMVSIVDHWGLPEEWLCNNGDEVKWQYADLAFKHARTDGHIDPLSSLVDGWKKEVTNKYMQELVARHLINLHE